MGAKPFRDVYTEEEVEALNDFVVFLEGHLKYIDIYRQINDFNVNLDKKIDEKTMQYNDLINKQKEFIAYVSHEVKSPLAAAIFQLDCILDDIETDEIEWGKLKTELSSLNTQLIKSGDLVSRLFSVQKYDYKKVKLYKETVCISELIKNEVSIFQKTFPGIDFVCTIEENHSLFFSLDTVQFLQVIDNLLNNAVKFSQR
ncbi:MAG: HAMP domain-containing histidine kinase [Candidatus Peribacteria bacterium]|nr:MAG: HAMP domain-containing histidine kinase [Candidatus Peribacteria bacterium]